MRPGADVAFLRNPLWVLALTLTLGLAAVPAAAQDLEVRRWSHLPVGVNTLAVGYAGQDTRIYFNPIVGITDGTADLNAWVARYSHTFDWSGKTARIDVMLPYVSGTWQGLVDGVPGQRTIRDRGDPWIRLGLNFYGAPANSGNAYRNYIAEHPIRTTIGASLAVSPPLGDYDPTELINVGTNRYAVRPQLGMLHVRRAWSFELTGSVFIFQDNTDFVDAITLSQEPVWVFHLWT
jgi:hypothetical protein